MDRPGAAGYEAGRYALTEYLTGLKAGRGATNGCNPVSRLRSGSGRESGRNIYNLHELAMDMPDLICTHPDIIYVCVATDQFQLTYQRYRSALFKGAPVMPVCFLIAT